MNRQKYPKEEKLKYVNLFAQRGRSQSTIRLSSPFARLMALEIMKTWLI